MDLIDWVLYFGKRLFIDPPDDTVPTQQKDEHGEVMLVGPEGPPTALEELFFAAVPLLAVLAFTAATLLVLYVLTMLMKEEEGREVEVYL